MRQLFVLMAIMLMVGNVSADAFSAWSASGDSWVATNDTHTIRMWNATGAHTWIADGNASSVEYLVVAGGGSGGSGDGTGNGGGGGGGGGMRTGTLAVSGSISVVVGPGGITSGSSHAGYNGGNSNFSTVNTSGGGYGSYGVAAGGNGGSGGGGSSAGGTGISGEGNDGGSLAAARTGGGAGSSGASGGNGRASNITGISTTYAKGALGGNISASPLSGLANTGNGGEGNYYTYTAAGGSGGSGVVIISYLTLPAGEPIVAAFTASANPSTTGAAVSFTDTSTGTPTTWNWTIDGSVTNTTQNAAYIFSTAGTHSVDLNVTNATGYFSNITHNQVVNDVPLNADFTAAPNPSNPDQVVTFTDTSTGSSLLYNWTFGDGNTSTIQNPTNTYVHTGTYNVFLNLSNTSGGWSNVSKQQVVTNVSSFTYKDLWQTPRFTLTVKVTDTSNVPILVSTVTDSNSATYTTTNGTAFFTEDYGTVVLYVAADGYDGRAVSYIVDEDRTVTVKLTKATPAGTPSTWYSPHQVRFAVVDSMGVKVVGSTINASAIATTLPTDGTADWLTAMYGIDPDAANDMMNGTLIMHGITQSDGATVFTMHSSIGYSLDVTNPSNGVIQTVNVTPIDTIYTIHLLGTAANNTYMDMGYNTSLYITEPDVHNVTMNLAYQDMSARTTLLEFFVLARSNNTVINYQSTSSIGSNVILMNHTVPNVRPDRYSWYYNAVRVK